MHIKVDNVIYNLSKFDAVDIDQHSKQIKLQKSQFDENGFGHLEDVVVLDFDGIEKGDSLFHSTYMKIHTLLGLI